MGRKAVSSGKKGAPKPREKGSSAGYAGGDIAPVQDARFASAEWDPRFSRVPKRAKKAIADDRFQKELKSNPAFRPRQTIVDRFGRPKGNASRLDKALQELAAASDESSSESEDEIKPVVASHVEESSEESDSEDEAFDGEEEVEDIPRGRATRRLAVLSLDWSSTRAVDIFASFSSFCPTGKRVKFVEVHPSKFGLERLAVEAKLGPQVVLKSDLDVVAAAKKQRLIGETEREGDSEDSEGDGEESGEEDAEQAVWKSQVALRRYEEERLKYYYAVASFEDAGAADAVYEQCDGVEYAQSGRAFDLRFIPEEMEIETKPRDRAEKIPEGYGPPNVTPSSINNSRVKLSWDADEPDRMVLKKRIGGKIRADEENLKAYLAGDSDEEEGEELERKKNLLLGGLEEEEEEDGDEAMEMEISFEPGMLEKGEDIVKRKLERTERKNESEWEARLRRQQERKAEKRRLRREKFAEKDAEDVAEDEGQEAKNPTFDDDDFFTVERDIDAAEKAESRKKRKAKKPAATSQRDARPADEASEQRAQAELELVAMQDVRVRRVTAADSDDEKPARKRSRKRRRPEMREADKVEKASALDVGDNRFEKLFSSHLFALDPTHAKFRENGTTRRIRDETGRLGDRKQKAQPADNAAEEALGLAQKIKSRAQGRARK